ncbi:MAG: hypothetical protein RLN76_05655 [Phycisphaeraceae bacterium]
MSGFSARHRAATALLVLSVVLMVSGCKKSPKSVIPKDLNPSVIVTGQPVPTYEQVAARHNQRVAELGRVWASTTLRIEWIEEKEHRSEQGDGNLLVIRPDRLALTVGKLGHVRLWAGMNPDVEYLFDKSGDGRVYVHRRGANEVSGVLPAELPVPLQPRDVPWLLGIMPLPDRGTVEGLNGYWLVEPAGLGVRLLIDPRTGSPYRIDRVGVRGQSAVIALHRDVAPVAGVDGPTPMMARKIQLMEAGKEARIDLVLDRLLAGEEAGDRIRSGAFDFERLMRAHEPSEVIEVR